MTQTLTGPCCFQWYLHLMNRADRARCHYCQSKIDTAIHTLFEYLYWSGHLDEFGIHLGHRSIAADLLYILCELVFEGLPANPEDKSVALRNAEEVFHLFYKMAETILQLKKEEEERVRQATKRRYPSPDPDSDA